MELKDLHKGDIIEFSDNSDAFKVHNLVSGTILDISETIVVISKMLDARHRKDKVVGIFYTNAANIKRVYSRNLRLITGSVWN